MSDPKNYQILNLVARGGTAVLYKAVQTSLERVVAVKKLHQHLTEDDNFTRRFVLEAKAAASLLHDNIVNIIDFGSEDKTYYMVMEFIDGESVRDILDRWKKLPADTALAIVHQVCQGLAHAHAKGIVHRDIKPGNIMITHSGKVKITDFGLAKLTQTTTQHTAENSILGTPLYMSPEQAFGETVDHRSDLFSLGTMLYELVTGVQPFRDENYMGVIQNIINKNAPHPSRFDIEVPSAVQSLLSKAMNKSREARFQSASDFKTAIEKVLGLDHLRAASDGLRHLLQADGETMLITKTIRHKERRSRLRRGFTAALVAVTLFGAAGIAYTYAPETVRQQVRELLRFTSHHDGGPAMQTSGVGSDLTSYVDALLDSAVMATQKVPDSVPTFHRDTVPDQPFAVPSLPTIIDTVADARPKGDARTPTNTAPAQPPQPTPAPAPEKVVRTGWISVTTEPWSEIYIDGKYRADASPTTRIELTRGTHTLECRNPKYKTYSESIRITTGEMSIRNVVLEKLRGRITLTTTEGAEVFVDGVAVGVTPLAKPLELDAGSHQVTVKKPGYNVWNNQIQVEAGATIPLKIVLSPLY